MLGWYHFISICDKVWLYIILWLIGTNLSSLMKVVRTHMRTITVLQNLTSTLTISIWNSPTFHIRIKGTRRIRVSNPTKGISPTLWGSPWICLHLLPLWWRCRPSRFSSRTIVHVCLTIAQIILIQERYNLPCMVCGFNSGSVIRRTAGCAAFSWCVCLFIFTGVFCCWIPFCIPACMDTEIVCYRCGFVKGVV